MCRSRQSFAHRVRRAGFSLLEMLLALALGSIITVGVVELLAANQRTHAVLAGQAQMHASARHALQFIARSARLAGHLGCARHPVRNVLNGAVAGLFEVNVAVGVMAFDGTGAGASSAAWTPALDVLPRRVGRRSVNAFRNRNGINVAVIPTHTDVLVFRFVDGLLPLVAPVTPGDDPVVESPRRGGLDADDFAVIADCERAALFRANAVDVSGDRATLRRRSGSGHFDNAPNRSLAGPDAGFGGPSDAAGATVGRVTTHIYYVARGSGANRRGEPPLSLWRKSGTGRPAELVQGIEDLQVLLGFDTDGDGVPNRYGPPGTGATADIRALRVAVTANDVDVAASGPTAAGANAAGLRRTFVQTIALRNR